MQVTKVVKKKLECHHKQRKKQACYRMRCRVNNKTKQNRNKKASGKVCSTFKHIYTVSQKEYSSVFAITL